MVIQIKGIPMIGHANPLIADLFLANLVQIDGQSV